MSLNRYRITGRTTGRYDPELEAAKRELLRDVQIEEFIETLSPEKREQALKEAKALVEQARKATQDGSYSEAVALLEKSYQTDQNSDTLNYLIETNVAWADTLLSIGEWRQAKQKLVALKREGLVITELYYTLARINLVAFEKEGSISTRPLKEALEEIEPAIVADPLNPHYHIEAARINATYALWWKGSPAGGSAVQAYLNKTIEHMDTACVAVSNDVTALEDMREVAKIIYDIGDPTEILPVHLLQTLSMYFPDWRLHNS